MAKIWRHIFWAIFSSFLVNLVEVITIVDVYPMDDMNYGYGLLYLVWCCVLKLVF